jgi:hypothetical protein
VPVLVSTLWALSAHGEDVVGYDAEGTCRSAIDAEIAQGSKLVELPGPPNPAMKDFYGTIVFDRTHNGPPAKIVYLCQGAKVSGGWVLAQIIYVDRESEDAARSEFERQKQLLEERLGVPCLDPSRLSDAQRALLPAGKTPEEALSPRTTWKAGPTVFTDISWSKLPTAVPAKWHVVIHTHGPETVLNAKETLSTFYRMRRCENLDQG